MPDWGEDTEDVDQDESSREVLKDIWIKEGNDWELGEVLEEELGNHKQIEKYSDAYKNRKLKLLAHIIRADNEDPMRQVALKQGSIKDKNVGKRRVGKSKLDWVHEGRTSAWKAI